MRCWRATPATTRLYGRFCRRSRRSTARRNAFDGSRHSDRTGFGRDAPSRSADLLPGRHAQGTAHQIGEGSAQAALASGARRRECQAAAERRRTLRSREKRCSHPQGTRHSPPEIAMAVGAAERNLEDGTPARRSAHDLSGRDPAELWQFYIQLVEVEAAFKNLKDDLQLRPIYHQKIGRIEAHIFVAFLAYCLHVTLRARLRPLASGLTPRAVLDKFAAIQMLDVHFPTTDGRTLILSRYTELNADQKLLVKQLDLDLPVQPRPRITAGGQRVQAAAPAL